MFVHAVVNKTSTVRKRQQVSFIPDLLRVRFFENWDIDIIVHLPTSKAGFDNLIVCREDIIGYKVLIPYLSSDGVLGIARSFFRKVVLVFGLPRGFRIDRDPLFTSNVWKALWRLWGTTQNFSTSYDKLWGGRIERANQTVELALRHLITNLPNGAFDWAEDCDLLQFLVNEQPSSKLQLSPNELLLGRSARVPLQWMAGLPSVSDSTIPAVTAFVEKRTKLIQAFKDAIREASDLANAFENSHRRDVQYDIGEKVLLSSANLNPLHFGPSYNSKTVPRFWPDPMKILKIEGIRAQLQLPPKLAKAKIHDWFLTSLFRRPITLPGKFKQQLQKLSKIKENKSANQHRHQQLTHFKVGDAVLYRETSPDGTATGNLVPCIVIGVDVTDPVTGLLREYRISSQEIPPRVWEIISHSDQFLLPRSDVNDPAPVLPVMPVTTPTVVTSGASTTSSNDSAKTSSGTVQNIVPPSSTVPIITPATQSLVNTFAPLNEVQRAKNMEPINMVALSKRSNILPPPSLPVAATRNQQQGTLSDGLITPTSALDVLLTPIGTTVQPLPRSTLSLLDDLSTVAPPELLANNMPVKDFLDGRWHRNAVQYLCSFVDPIQADEWIYRKHLSQQALVKVDVLFPQFCQTAATHNYSTRLNRSATVTGNSDATPKRKT
jgi:hypothetical protein